MHEEVVTSESLNSIQYSSTRFLLYSAFYNKRKYLQVLYRGINPEPEYPGKHRGKKKLLTERNLEQDQVSKEEASC